MITFIFTVKKREIKEDFLQRFNVFYGEKEVFIAVEEGKNLNLTPSPEVSAHKAYFNKDTREEDMIESLISRVNAETLVIVRDGEKPIIFEDLKNAVVKQREGYDIVLLKKEKGENKFKTFFSNILKASAAKMFGFNFFDGELTVEVFGANAINILKTNGTGNLAKINRWVGASVGYVNADVEKKTFKSKKQNNLKLITIFNFLAFILVLAGTIVLGVLVSLPWLAILGLIFLNFVVATIAVYNLLRYYTDYRVGDLTASKVAIINFVEVKNDEQ